MEGSRAQSFAINNEKLRALQKESPSGQGPVLLDYFGHSCVRITSPAGVSLLIDPWRNDSAWGWWFPREFPEIEVDLAVSTHAHFDHDALHRPLARMTMERMVGSWSLADMRVTGLADKHMHAAVGKTRWTEIQKDIGEDFSPPGNKLHMDNVIYVVETAGVTIVHWGDNRPDPSSHVLETLRAAAIDVLLLPVDESEHILTYQQADALMRELKPGLTIPIHYLIHGVNTALSTLQPCDPWVETHEDTLGIGAARLAVEPGKNQRTGSIVASFANCYTLE